MTGNIEFQTQERGNVGKNRGLLKNIKSLHHGLVSELLLHNHDEFRMFLRMNTEIYEVSKFEVSK